MSSRFPLLRRGIGGVCFLLALGSGRALELPKGWLAPADYSFYGAWRKTSPTRYLGTGLDLDYDGLRDSVLILQPAKGLGIGIIEFLRHEDATVRARQMFRSGSYPR